MEAVAALRDQRLEADEARSDDVAERPGSGGARRGGLTEWSRPRSIPAARVGAGAAAAVIHWIVRASAQSSGNRIFSRPRVAAVAQRGGRRAASHHRRRAASVL